MSPGTRIWCITDWRAARAQRVCTSDQIILRFIAQDWPIKCWHVFHLLILSRAYNCIWISFMVQCNALFWNMLSNYVRRFGKNSLLPCQHHSHASPSALKGRSNMEQAPSSTFNFHKWEIAYFVRTCLDNKTSGKSQTQNKA